MSGHRLNIMVSITCFYIDYEGFPQEFCEP